MQWLRERLFSLREAFWFVPALALAAAIALGVLLVEIDAAVQPSLAEDFPRFFGVAADGARNMLAAIAGSMITVAGVVFSVTIVALSLAAGTYSPRVLRTFMRDRPTQGTFGVFVGVFAYCLVVLRTVRATEPDGTGGFVPSVAVLGALFLALAGVAALVYFVHHVAVMIQVSSILQRIADDTRKAIDRLFPDELGERDEGAAEDLAIAREWHALPARRSGYVVSVAADGLLAFARRCGTVLRMDVGVGEFAVEGLPLASLAAPGADVDADARALDNLYVIGAERSIEQDAGFGIQQIVDVAARALSPGVHDPGTAILCVDHLSALLARLARRRIPSPLRHEAGALRVIARAPTFESLADQALSATGRYARGEPEVLDSLARAARSVERAAPPRRAAFMRGHLETILARRAEC